MAEVYTCTEQVRKQWMGVMMHEDAMRREESCPEFDNIRCLEGGFLIKRMGMALCAKALHHEGVWCGWHCATRHGVSVSKGANTIAS